MSVIDFLPLGGSGEIGMNLNLYGAEGRWLAVDAGVLFDRVPGGGNRVFFPDITFIERRRTQLDGLVVTHAHQDHLGALVDLWPRLRCPVYLTPFARAMLEEPLRYAGLRGKIPFRILTEDARFEVGPFQLERVPLTHSTVEMGALLIRTTRTTVLHTGDFKLDPDPVVGSRSAIQRLKELGDEGVDVCVSDSTNADVPGRSVSEGVLEPHLTRVIRDAPGRVAVSLFSSNIARIQTLFRVAEQTEREIVLLGRSLIRTLQAARRAGYLQDAPSFVQPRYHGYLPRERVMIVCTGSQGEARAALSRLAVDGHRDVTLEDGDTAVFSARTIPGNEPSLLRLRTQLLERGVKVVMADEHATPLHASGHPCRDELVEFYTWLRPQRVIPVHGTPKKLHAHARLAKHLGLRTTEVRNGDRIDLTTGRRVDQVRVGRIERVEEERTHDSRQRHGRRTS